MNRHHAPIPGCWKLFSTGVASFMMQCPICTVGGRLASIILASIQQFIIVEFFVYPNSKWKPVAQSVRNNKWLLIDVFIFSHILPVFIHLYMWLFHMQRRIYNIDFSVLGGQRIPVEECGIVASCPEAECSLFQHRRGHAGELVQCCGKPGFLGSTS